MGMKMIIKESLAMMYYHGYKKYNNMIGNRSLIYHAFGSKLDHDTYGISIPIDRFREHIKYLSENYRINKAIDYISHNNTSISITIDDGYKDTLDAIEILEYFNVPVLLFITTNFINKKNYLSDSDLRDISKINTLSIGAHGKSHQRLGALDYENQKKELKGSKAVLEEILGYEINTVSFPHGSHNKDTLNLLQDLGYMHGFSSIKGINNKFTNKYLLRRSEVISTDKTEDLDKKIKGYYDYY